MILFIHPGVKPYIFQYAYHYIFKALPFVLQSTKYKREWRVPLTQGDSK